MALELPRPALVVLVGPSASGKSTWAAGVFAASEILSSDALRAMVGEADDDLAASADAFAVLDAIVEARLRRGLTVVVDTLGLEPARRRAYLEAARRHGLLVVAVVFETPAETCRAWNAARPRPVRADVLRAQLRQLREASEAVDREGFDAVLRPSVGAAGEPAAAAVAPAAATAGRSGGLRFGLHVSRFDWEGGREAMPAHLQRTATEAAEAGFESIWVMDHARQIPQVGRA